MDHIVRYDDIMPLFVVTRHGAFGGLEGKRYCLERNVEDKSTYVVGCSGTAAVPRVGGNEHLGLLIGGCCGLLGCRRTDLFIVIPFSLFWSWGGHNGRGTA